MKVLQSPGGQKEAYDLVTDVLEEISAKAPEDGKYVTRIGSDGRYTWLQRDRYRDMQLRRKL